jgi:hypothetical protein
MERNMSDISEEIKQTAQLRKAIMPLIKVLRDEANADITNRLLTIENIVGEMAKKETVFNVAPPEVNVNVEPPVIPLPVSAYEPHDQSKSSVYQYSGFMRSNGDYYIQRVAKGEQRYAVGNGDYANAWEKRKTLKYGYIDEVK